VALLDEIMGLIESSVTTLSGGRPIDGVYAALMMWREKESKGLSDGP
jgi:hypothetical protein